MTKAQFLARLDELKTVEGAPALLELYHGRLGEFIADCDAADLDRIEAAFSFANRVRNAHASGALKAAKAA